MLRQPHRPDEHAGLGPSDIASKSFHIRFRRAGLLLERLPGLSGKRFAESLVSLGVISNEGLVRRTRFDQALRYTIEERHVTTHVDEKEVVRKLCAEQRALGGGRNPVSFHSRFAVRI